jgi:hypothetical protein
VSSTSHWEAVYRGRVTGELGWCEPRPSTLDLVLRFSEPTDPAIDVGASRLVDELVYAGYEQITVLDLCETALDRAQARLRSAAGKVTWIRSATNSRSPYPGQHCGPMVTTRRTKEEHR